MEFENAACVKEITNIRYDQVKQVNQENQLNSGESGELGESGETDESGDSGQVPSHKHQQKVKSPNYSLFQHPR